MKQFSIATVLLIVTWCGIGFYVLSRYLAEHPYRGATHGISNTVLYESRIGAELESTQQVTLESMPAWNAAAANPPLSAKRALLIADRIRRERLRDNKDWKWGLRSLTLHPLDTKNQIWCWRIEFDAEPVSHDVIGAMPALSTIVMMDGSCYVQTQAGFGYMKEIGILTAATSGTPTLEDE
ncbi:hypothetical protein [Novipirellula caenicola]|uniref:Uncharacterized protein n=1 Tax=Novipirellula caenicola TaxID=1536901 RepID=A0ABP9VK59_9BACT